VALAPGSVWPQQRRWVGGEAGNPLGDRLPRALSVKLRNIVLLLGAVARLVCSKDHTDHSRWEGIWGEGTLGG
jgi:hypothetical protein